jgi:hypothetical protein
MWIVPRDPKRDFMGVRFPREDSTCLPKLVYYKGILLSDPLCKELRADCGADPGDIKKVFYCYGNIC